jgi:hypothetical protein
MRINWTSGSIPTTNFPLGTALASGLYVWAQPAPPLLTTCPSKASAPFSFISHLTSRMKHMGGAAQHSHQHRDTPSLQSRGTPRKPPVHHHGQEAH